MLAEPCTNENSTVKTLNPKPFNLKKPLYAERRRCQNTKKLWALNWPQARLHRSPTLLSSPYTPNGPKLQCNLIFSVRLLQQPVAREAVLSRLFLSLSIRWKKIPHQLTFKKQTGDYSSLGAASRTRFPPSIFCALSFCSGHTVNLESKIQARVRQLGM